MEYMLPRLRGWGESLSRQAGGRVAGGGGIGTRGPGETKIETDRRRIRQRSAKLRREIAGHEDRPRGQAPGAPPPRRPERRRSPATPTPGKSSLLNRLTGAGVLVENALFATLDPTVRRAETPDGRALHARRHGRLRPPPAAPAGRGVPLDAGGGRRSRPGPARRRRLASRPARPARRRTRGAGRDRGRPRARARRASTRPTWPIRTLSPGSGGPSRTPSRCRRVTGAGLDELRERIAGRLPQDVEVTLLVPYDRGDVVARVHEHGRVVVGGAHRRPAPASSPRSLLHLPRSLLRSDSPFLPFTDLSCPGRIDPMRAI